MTCIHHYSVTPSSFTALKILCAPPILPSLSPNPWQPLIFLVSIVVPFTECHIVGIIQYVNFFGMHFKVSSMSFHGLIVHFLKFFWLSWVFIAVRRLSLVVVSGGYSSLQCMGFSLRWLLLWSTGSRHTGFSSCGTPAQYLWLVGLVAPWHVGSSQTRDRTRVPCIGRQILNHCATREVPVHFF